MALEFLGLISNDEAKVWKEEVLRLNEETYQLLRDVGTALQAVNENADSAIVDDIYKYGSQILSGTNKILEGMNQLATMVTDLLSKVNAILETGKNAIKGLAEGVIADF